MSEPTVDVRAAFERWYSEGGWPCSVERQGDGYKYAQAHAAWITWQAAWAAREAAVANLIAERDALHWALIAYPRRNTHQLQAQKVCDGVISLAVARVGGEK